MWESRHCTQSSFFHIFYLEEYRVDSNRRLPGPSVAVSDNRQTFVFCTEEGVMAY